MNRKRNDQDQPVGRLKRIADFLPSPEELAIPDETVKITIALRKSSVTFFKREALRNRTKYQRMIRDVVDRYATAYEHKK